MRRWCDAEQRTPGATIGLGQAWRLSQLWYENRLTSEWRPRTAVESQALLEAAELRGDAWRLGAAPDQSTSR